MKLKTLLTFFFFFLLILCSTNIHAQVIPSNKVLPIEDLTKYLKKSAKKELKDSNKAALAMYLRKKFSERFFYDYTTFEARLSHYNNIFNNQEDHKRRAMDHLAKYNDSTQWVLPFNYLNGDAVDAYALRHLARQHKMVDIALYYFNDKKDPQLIRYFENQMRSLNAALEVDQYETVEDGNGVYEAFRSGYRILNWLWIHNMFLNESEYSDEDQLTTVATLLQHGQHLYDRNDTFKYGNHQTRGVSALAILAIIFSDFEGTDLWLERALTRLGEHMDKEINSDGFQFERSVHYHMSDINNYFYVYQLAKINSVEVDQVFENKLRGLFTTLVKIAYPDGSAPVFQDDTEIPWAEKNDISAAMTLGYLLFQDPEFGYFATNKVDDRVYWFLGSDQIKMLEKMDKKKPDYGSLALRQTGYYIMREGWNRSDKMMAVSAGLDPEKPDHQHGDMLGIQAIAHGNAILPNYQVRYSLKDFEFFKNSMVKNVALVDNELQGKEWTSNKGGSGFGKFGILPHPEVLGWESNDHFDFFTGRHDGFENIGVKYSRQVVYVKDDFWIVKDNFSSDQEHEYKQVWQGHYTLENGPDLLRATTQDATGHDIMQLVPTDSVWSSGTRGKHWSVVSQFGKQDFSFITIIYPYKGYHNRINEEADKLTINEWKLNESVWKMIGENALNISSEEGTYVFNVTELNGNNLSIKSNELMDLFVAEFDDNPFIRSISSEGQLVTVTQGQKVLSKILAPGELWILND